MLPDAVVLGSMPSLPSLIPSIPLAPTTAAAMAAAMEGMSTWLPKLEGLKPRPRLACSMAGSGLMSGGEPGAPPTPCMFASHSAMMRCCERICCCFMARSRLYMGPNLLRPPLILSCLTAVGGEKKNQVNFSFMNGLKNYKQYWEDGW